MPKYEVDAREIVYYTIEVDAQNEVDAMEKARDICCSKHIVHMDYYEVDAVNLIKEEENANL